MTDSATPLRTGPALRLDELGGPHRRAAELERPAESTDGTGH
ncbi:hypothetical protein [Streptomyces yaizuensis]|uniref:Uncharacterized protein n=1 Tax=Streptomyces yaizuensis TaxID=2989713 RepID=A0ABQ5P0C2_9ACTN|nr:hypothetical protein [Streptomyces sp. YSPA8]GLF95888.1 hypothetical protein SYYSPA8_16345 [Streptomyces sp. YSPA8]